MIIDDFIVEWNRRYPIDFLWRKKFGVRFGSPEHLATSHLNMAIEIREETLLNSFRKQRERANDEEEMRSIGVDVDRLRETKKMSQNEIDSVFETFDIGDLYKDQDPQ